MIEVVKPTCTEEGYELHECLGFVGNDQGWPQCDYNHKTNIVPALGHDWGDWVVTTQPTQDSEGVETRTCSRCSEKETRKLDKLTPSETEPADPKPTDPEPTDPEPTEPETTEPKPTEPGIDTSNSVIVTSEALAVINKYRAENGLAPYSAGGGEECAKIRAAELQISFSHTRPDGNICAGLLSQYGFWSECIAWGASSAQGAVDMWMASNDGHREIMLDPSYTYATIARNGDKWVFMAG